jgi:hypothetical protein
MFKHALKAIIVLLSAGIFFISVLEPAFANASGNCPTWGRGFRGFQQSQRENNNPYQGSNNSLYQGAGGSPQGASGSPTGQSSSSSGTGGR